MPMLRGLLVAAFLFPTLVLAQEATVTEVHDKPAVPGSIIANLLEKHDNPFVLSRTKVTMFCIPTPATSIKMRSRPITGAIKPSMMK